MNVDFDDEYNKAIKEGWAPITHSNDWSKAFVLGINFNYGNLKLGFRPRYKFDPVEADELEAAVLSDERIANLVGIIPPHPGYLEHQIEVIVADRVKFLMMIGVLWEDRAVQEWRFDVKRWHEYQYEELDKKDREATSFETKAPGKYGAPGVIVNTRLV